MTEGVSTADERTIWDDGAVTDAGSAGAEIAPDRDTGRRSIPLDEFWARLDDGRH